MLNSLLVVLAGSKPVLQKTVDAVISGFRLA